MSNNNNNIANGLSQQLKVNLLNNIFSENKLNCCINAHSVVTKALETQQLSFIPTSLRNYLLNVLKIKTCYPLFELFYDYTKKGKKVIRIAQSTLAKIINQSLTSVKRQIKKLSQLGLIRITRIFDSSIRNYVNMYEFTLPPDIVNIVQNGNERIIKLSFDKSDEEEMVRHDAHVDLYNSCLGGVTCDPLNSFIYNNIIVEEIFDKNEVMDVPKEQEKTNFIKKLVKKGRAAMNVLISDPNNDVKICKQIEHEIKAMIKRPESAKPTSNRSNQINKKISEMNKKLTDIKAELYIAEKNWIEASKEDKYAFYKPFSKLSGEYNTLSLLKQNLENETKNEIMESENIQKEVREISFDHVKYVYCALKQTSKNLCETLTIVKQILWAFHDKTLDGDLQDEGKILNKGIFSAKKRTWQKPMSYPS